MSFMTACRLGFHLTTTHDIGTPTTSWFDDNWGKDDGSMTVQDRSSHVFPLLQNVFSREDTLEVKRPGILRNCKKLGGGGEVGVG